MSCIRRVLWRKGENEEKFKLSDSIKGIEFGVCLKEKIMWKFLCREKTTNFLSEKDVMLHGDVLEGELLKLF